MSLYHGNTYTSPLIDFQFVNIKAVYALLWALIYAFMVEYQKAYIISSSIKHCGAPTAIMTYVVCSLHTAYVIVAVPVWVRVSQLHKVS